MSAKGDRLRGVVNRNNRPEKARFNQSVSANV